MMMLSSSSDILQQQQVKVQVLLPPPKLNIISSPPATRRRRRHLVIRNQLSSSSDNNLFNSFISQLDLVSPLTTTALATASASAAAIAILYNSTFTTTTSRSSSIRHHQQQQQQQLVVNNINNNNDDIGYWSLFTSPTPFNRFIKLRCPSLLLPPHLEHDDFNVEEDGGHVVTFDTGPIQHHTHLLLGGGGNNNDNQVSYQRVCVNTDDAGVISLDWPSHLELTNKEHALDTTVFIVPGTTHGSMDQSVISFVYKCLNRGCFPIVMNPRGCARSPLTTPR